MFAITSFQPHFSSNALLNLTIPIYFYRSCLKRGEFFLSRNPSSLCHTTNRVVFTLWKPCWTGVFPLCRSFSHLGFCPLSFSFLLREVPTFDFLPPLFPPTLFMSLLQLFRLFQRFLALPCKFFIDQFGVRLVSFFSLQFFLSFFIRSPQQTSPDVTFPPIVTFPLFCVQFLLFPGDSRFSRKTFGSLILRFQI